MSMDFRGANIHGGEFRSINQSGIHALSQAISHGAMHDSAERDPPPRCHPGTREKATEDIVRWIEESNPSTTVLWVSGRAGVGKSALMQKLAELDGIYFGGCFFFRRGIPGCNVKDHLFSTLAYQLATNVHGILEHVDRAMIQDFSLPKRSAAVQLKRLIIEPIRLLPIPARPTIIIIDGLDECEDLNSQRDILALIGQVTMDRDVAIRFIIASRPEHQICDMFNKEPLFSRTRRLVLDEGYDTAADIERYLRDKFEDIHSRNKDLMPDVESPWPLESDLQMLVWKASGQFIYAATVIKFVDSDADFRTPEEKLNIILKPGPMQGSAFSELDRLYTQILSQYPDSEVLVHTLGVILVLEDASNHTYPKQHVHSPATIAAVTGLGEAKLQRMFRALQSVMEIRNNPVFDDADDNEPTNTNIQLVKLSHRSFHDFLTIKARSGPYFIDKELLGGQVFCRILELATISIKKLRSCSSSSLPTTNPDIWRQFEAFSFGAGWPKTSGKMELYSVLNNLRAVLFNDQPPLSGQLSKPFCAALIPTLNCVCSALHFGFLPWYWLFPRGSDPLQLYQLVTQAQNLLDECFRQTIAGPSSTLIHLAFRINEYTPKSLRGIGNICNISDRQRLSRFVNEHSYWIHIHTIVEDKYVLGYYLQSWVRNFILNPNRSRYLYSTSLVIDECQKAIQSLILEPNGNSDSTFRFAFFFMPTEPNKIPIANATRLLENASDRNKLQFFLEYLSEIPWFDIYNRDESRRHFTNGIVHWMWTTLESSSLGSGDIRDAMCKAFTQILARGILPALSQHISQANELGIFENQGCLGCLPHWPKMPKEFLDILGFDMLSQILPMLIDQTFFQTLTTGMVESMLLGIMWHLLLRYYPSHTCGEGSDHSEGHFELDPFDLSHWDSDSLRYLPDSSHQRNWSFAFTHASTSSKCILFSIRCLIQLYPLSTYHRYIDWIVGEMIDWLKSQTADPQPQDHLIAWMEDARKKLEEATAIQKQKDIDEGLRESAEWASVIQKSQTM